MDQPPAKRRFRFGLRTLLLLVAVIAVLCSAYMWATRVGESKLARIEDGMTVDEVLWRLGSPNEKSNGPQQDMWNYDHDSLLARVYFYKDGTVAGVYWYDQESGSWSGPP